MKAMPIDLNGAVNFRQSFTAFVQSIVPANKVQLDYSRVEQRDHESVQIARRERVLRDMRKRGFRPEK